MGRLNKKIYTRFGRRRTDLVHSDRPANERRSCSWHSRSGLQLQLVNEWETVLCDKTVRHARSASVLRWSRGPVEGGSVEITQCTRNSWKMSAARCRLHLRKGNNVSVVSRCILSLSLSLLSACLWFLLYSFHSNFAPTAAKVASLGVGDVVEAPRLDALSALYNVLSAPTVKVGHR